MYKLGALLVLVCVVVVVDVSSEPLTAQQYRDLVQRLHIAEQRTGDDFWTSAVTNTREQCSAHYFGLIADNFQPLADDGDMVYMYHLLDQHIMDYCDQEFMPYSRRITDLCPEGSDCFRVTEGFQLHAYRDEDDEEAMAHAVAQVMYEEDDDIRSADEFEEVYLTRGPCRVIYNALELFVGYSQTFLTLISQPAYYDRFDGDHQQAADVVGACNHIQGTDGFLRQAWNHYRNL